MASHGTQCIPEQQGPPQLARAVLPMEGPPGARQPSGTSLCGQLPASRRSTRAHRRNIQPGKQAADDQLGGSQFLRRHQHQPLEDHHAVAAHREVGMHDGGARGSSEGCRVRPTSPVRRQRVDGFRAPPWRSRCPRKRPAAPHSVRTTPAAGNPATARRPAQAGPRHAYRSGGSQAAPQVGVERHLVDGEALDVGNRKAHRHARRCQVDIG